MLEKFGFKVGVAYAEVKLPATHNEKWDALCRKAEEISPGHAADWPFLGWSAVFDFGWQAAERHHGITD